MKKTVITFMTLAIVALTAGCSKNDQPLEQKRFCEIGNTGKVVSSCNVSTNNTLASNMTLWYCPDCSKITTYDLSEGIPGMLMKDYSFVLSGDAVIDNDGEVIYKGFKFNDKGYVSHLVDLKNFSTSQGTTHVTYDIEYNDEDRMSRITYNFLDANENPTRIQHIDLFWENGLLKSVQFDNNGEINTATYEYGSRTNVHRQPSVSFFNSLNLLSLDVIRPFLVAGYFGKGPDRFEVSSNNTGSSVAENRSYSVELDAEGKITALYEEYGENRHKEYTFTYSESGRDCYSEWMAMTEADSVIFAKARAAYLDDPANKGTAEFTIMQFLSHNPLAVKTKAVENGTNYQFACRDNYVVTVYKGNGAEVGKVIGIEEGYDTFPFPGPIPPDPRKRDTLIW